MSTILNSVFTSAEAVHTYNIHGRIFRGGLGGVQTPPGSGKHPPRKC